MTVSELIAKLQEMPGEARVVYMNGEDGATDVKVIGQDPIWRETWNDEPMDPVVIS